LGLALAATACGADGKSPSVANLGGSTTTTAAPPASSSGGGPSGGGSGPRSGFTLKGGKEMAKFASCMRKHGVPNFPDPSSDGSVTITSGSRIDPNSPAFRNGQKACEKYMPRGGQAPSPAQQAKLQAQALKFSACMRAHGLPNFPDPQFSPGRMSIRIQGKGIDPNSPIFKAAQKACAKDLPGASTGTSGQ